MTNKLQKSFEKELEWHNVKKPTYDCDCYYCMKHGKLIDNLLHAVEQEKQELREKIAGMKRPHVDGNCQSLDKENQCIFCRQHYQYCDCERPFNEALDEVLKLL